MRPIELISKRHKEPLTAAISVKFLRSLASRDLSARGSEISVLHRKLTRNKPEVDAPCYEVRVSLVR